MTISTLLVTPFADYAFMRRALAACLILSISAVPLGLFMQLRRLTLVGDAVSHAILPGVAVAFLLAGLNLWGMAAGGLVTGILVALLAVGISRTTQLKDDASFTLVYLLSLAGGVTLLSVRGSNLDLVHILFGNILGIDDSTLWLIAGTACLTLLVLAAIYRGLVIDCFDPEFAVAHRRTFVTPVFFLLLTLNLVAAFQALGTLLALGLMILPALTARFWTRTLDGMLPLAILLAMFSSLGGLLVSYQLNMPSGPAIVLIAGALALLSAIGGRYGSMRLHFWP